MVWEFCLGIHSNSWFDRLRTGKACVVRNTSIIFKLVRKTCTFTKFYQIGGVLFYFFEKYFVNFVPISDTFCTLWPYLDDNVLWTIPVKSESVWSHTSSGMATSPKVLDSARLDEYVTRLRVSCPSDVTTIWRCDVLGWIWYMVYFN